MVSAATVRLALTSLLLLLCGCREPQWVFDATFEHDGWSMNVPAGYAPVTKNAAALRRRAPEFGQLLEADGGELMQKLSSTYVLTTGLGCTLSFAHVKAEGACERSMKYRDAHGQSAKVELPNGAWVYQAAVGSEGGTIYTWDHCEPDQPPEGVPGRGYDELFTVISSTMPSCVTDARNREAMILKALGSSKLSR